MYIFVCFTYLHLCCSTFDQLETSAQSGNSGLQVKIFQMPHRLKAMYKFVKNLKVITGLYRFHFSSELLGQEMDCVIEFDDVALFATI